MKTGLLGVVHRVFTQGSKPKAELATKSAKRRKNETLMERGRHVMQGEEK